MPISSPQMTRMFGLSVFLGISHSYSLNHLSLKVAPAVARAMYQRIYLGVMWRATRQRRNLIVTAKDLARPVAAFASGPPAEGRQRQAWPPWVDTIASTASRLNEAGFWRGGNLVKFSICAATVACMR